MFRSSKVAGRKPMESSSAPPAENSFAATFGWIKAAGKKPVEFASAPASDESPVTNPQPADLCSEIKPGASPKALFGNGTPRIETIDLSLSLDNISVGKERESSTCRSEEEIIRLWERTLETTTHREGQLNARNTISLVAILIATVTFASGTVPPGGVQEVGSLPGTAVAADRTAFKIFTVCNHLALSASLFIVLVMSSVVPHARAELKRFTVVFRVMMWVAAVSMAAAYVAAALVVSPLRNPGALWMLHPAFCICFSVISAAFLFVLGFIERPLSHKVLFGSTVFGIVIVCLCLLH